MDTMDESYQNESLRAMQLLRDNFTLWGIDIKVEKKEANDNMLDDIDPTAKSMLIKNKRAEARKKKRFDFTEDQKFNEQN